eukprot:TRINITY_DN112668_c0_g1_i1.p1 TRINITY_DN112668_c0_g1~~TRINITY_DN112668_c0_g1_i1.p1  ORF type:complete len:160 (+),score=23.25 TRINITY_DN112668_c0_g1_i1:55-534(+)
MALVHVHAYFVGDADYDLNMKSFETVSALRCHMEGMLGIDPFNEIQFFDGQQLLRDEDILGNSTQSGVLTGQAVLTRSMSRCLDLLTDHQWRRQACEFLCAEAQCAGMQEIELPLRHILQDTLALTFARDSCEKVCCSCFEDPSSTRTQCARRDCRHRL